MNYSDLPELVQYKINKILFSQEVLPNLEHKDWWWHTVKSRSECWEHYIDPENIPRWIGKNEYFSNGDCFRN